MPSSAGQPAQPAMSFEAFTNAAPDSLYWYDRLPGDGFSVCAIPQSPSIEHLRDALLATSEPSTADIDLLAAFLLGHEHIPAQHERWKALTQHLSRCMAAQLTSDGNRPLRMRTQRLHYYIEALIADAPSVQDHQCFVGERNLEAMKPWDYVEHRGCEWWISSGSPNIYCDNGRQLLHWNLGLPTQLDPLPDGRLCAGSIYSNGASIHERGQWVTLNHDQPVPLVFWHNARLYFIDHLGNLWCDEPRQFIARVPCKQVHFARYFEGTIYCLDNSDYGHITSFNVDRMVSVRHAVLPVQVCNDLAIVGQHCYLIDKQQGSVFKFDRTFRFLEQRLHFGRGQARLLDPVSIRLNGDQLDVVSWLSQKLTRLRVF